MKLVGTSPWNTGVCTTTHALCSDEEQLPTRPATPLRGYLHSLDIRHSRFRPFAPIPRQRLTSYNDRDKKRWKPAPQGDLGEEICFWPTSFKEAVIEMCVATNENMICRCCSLRQYDDTL